MDPSARAEEMGEAIDVSSTEEASYFISAWQPD
jgi:hypothetical protein